MSGARIWLMAARPRTLPAAVAPVLVGTTAAVWETGGDDFRLGAFIAALIGSVFLQIGTNLANDSPLRSLGGTHRHRIRRLAARHLQAHRR